jgi:hypothetical protein
MRHRDGPTAPTTELDIRIRQILYRWQPKTADPETLARDLYALIAWALDGEDPPEDQVLRVD